MAREECIAHFNIYLGVECVRNEEINAAEEVRDDERHKNQPDHGVQELDVTQVQDVVDVGIGRERLQHLVKSIDVEQLEEAW